MTMNINCSIKNLICISPSEMHYFMLKVILTNQCDYFYFRDEKTEGQRRKVIYIGSQKVKGK